MRGNTSTRKWVRTATCVSALLALGAVISGSAGAATITSWIGGKGATPDIVTAGGGACPGTMTTINGTGFTADGGVPSVTIGGVPSAQIIVGSDIILYARVGTGATSGNLVLTTPAGSVTATQKVTVVPCQSTGAAATKPTIDSATKKAKAGKKITLHGIGFVGLKSVTIGGAAATYAVPSDNLMYVIMPDGAKAGVLPLVLTNTLGKAATTVTKTG